MSEQDLPRAPNTSDENMGGRTIHVPASGRVEDAPRPNAAEPLPDQGPPDGGVARVDAELASKDNDPNRRIAKGVQNTYVSPETTEGSKHSDNAAVTPADEKPPTEDRMTGLPGGEPGPEHFTKPEDAGFKVKSDADAAYDETKTKAKDKTAADRDNKRGDTDKPIV